MTPEKPATTNSKPEVPQAIPADTPEMRLVEKADGIHVEIQHSGSIEETQKYIQEHIALGDRFDWTMRWKRLFSGAGHTFRDLMSGKFFAPAPLIEGLMSEGYSAFLAGERGEGKTFLALQASVALALGKPFLGRDIARPYRVVFIDAENGLGLIKERLQNLAQKLGLDPGDLRTLEENLVIVDREEEGTPLYLLNLSSQSGFGYLNDYVRQYEPEVLIFDCLAKFLPGSETDEETIKQFCSGLNSCLRQHKSLCSILLLHHMVKFNQDMAQYNLLEYPSEFLSKVRGSGRLQDLIPIRLAMAKAKDATGEAYQVVNGIMRAGTIVPILLQRDENGFFDLHQDKALVEEKCFAGAGRQMELYRLVKAQFGTAGEFTWTHVVGVHDTAGKKFNKKVITEMLKTAVASGLMNKGTNGSYTFPR